MGRLGLKLLLYLIGLAAALGLVWGVWATISGWNATKAELNRKDQALTTALEAKKESDQYIVTEEDGLRATQEEAARLLKESEAEHARLTQRALIQAQASSEAGDKLDEHLTSRGDIYGLELHAQERALTNAERLTWQAREAALLAGKDAIRMERDSLRVGIQAYRDDKVVMQTALTEALASQARWKQAAKPTFGKVIKRTVIPVLLTAGTMILVNSASN